MHSCAAAKGSAWCWGDNEFGQVGSAACSSADTPTQVPELAQVVAVSAGDRHSCALNSAGEAWCWGDGSSGQLGAAAAGAGVPVMVSAPQ